MFRDDPVIRGPGNCAVFKSTRLHISFALLEKAPISSCPVFKPSCFFCASENHTKVYVKLFANLDDDFKYALLNQVQIQFFKARAAPGPETMFAPRCFGTLKGEPHEEIQGSRFDCSLRML